MALVDEEPEAPEFVRRVSVVVSGLYAWGATVLEPLLAPGASVLARVAGGASLALLGVGIAMGRRRPRLARGLGLHGFVGTAVVAWLLLGGLVGVERLEPTRAALGAIGWVLFAFVWGEPREMGRVPEDDPHVLTGEGLAPRGQLPSGAAIVLGASIAAAAVPLLVAWRVTRPYHALFAQAVAVACAVAVVTVGAEVAVERGRWNRLEPPRRRLSQAALPLAALGLALFAGIVQILTG